MSHKYDWSRVITLCRQLAKKCNGPTELCELLKANDIDIPRTTLSDALRRYDVTLEYNTEHVPSVTVSVDANTMDVVVKQSNRILTLEQAVEIAQVDLDVWEVHTWEFRKWEVGAKAEAKNLKWENGVIVSGYVKSPGLVIEPLFGIQVRFRRKKPVTIQPVIQPIACDLVYEQSKPHISNDKVYRALVWGDPHFGYRRDLTTGCLTPYHDRRVLDLVIELMLDTNPDRMDILGDWFDLGEWTTHFLRSPEFYQTTQPAILEGHWWLQLYRIAKPDIPICLHQGNHDKRMADAMMTHLQAAYGLRAADEYNLPYESLSPPRLLALHQLGIDWMGNYPQDEDWLNSELYLMHGDMARQLGLTAKATAEKSTKSCIFGHIHRRERATYTPFVQGGWAKPVTAVCPGCACHLDGRVPGHVPRSQSWQQGVAIVDYTNSGDFHIEVIEIDDGVAIYNGKRYVGWDHLDELQRSFPEWNWGG